MLGGGHRLTSPMGVGGGIGDEPTNPGSPCLREGAALSLVVLPPTSSVQKH